MTGVQEGLRHEESTPFVIIVILRRTHVRAERDLPARVGRPGAPASVLVGVHNRWYFGSTVGTIHIA